MKRQLAATEKECWLCLGRLGPLDFSLPCGHPLSVEIDEEIPVSRGGDPLSLDNVHLVHRFCNLKKGNRVLFRGAFACEPEGRPDSPGPRTSRKWF